MKKTWVFYIVLGIVSLLLSCGQSKTEGTSETNIVSEEILFTKENEKIEEKQENELYDYEVEEKKFTFSISEEETYSIPYIRVNGCPNEQLEWRINHVLWENACWLFECQDLGNNMYGLFESESKYSIVIAGVYKCGKYLSVIYEEPFYTEDIGGYITYAIVVDILSGERILLSEMIEDKKLFQELVAKEEKQYYGDDLDEKVILERIQQIMLYGEMTEAETVIYNATFGGKYPEKENGNMDSISWLFASASFYMTEEEFVIMPGARYYRPISFKWEEIEGIVKNPLV